MAFARSGVEPFVFGVKRGDGNIYNTHPANGSMAATGADKYTRKRLNRYRLSVEFHVPVPLEDEIYLCHFLMIVRAVGL